MRIPHAGRVDAGQVHGRSADFQGRQKPDSRITARYLHRTDPVRKPPTPFPTLFADAPERWQWPTPPFAWRHVPAPPNDMPQPCRLERKSGTVIEGDMLGFDPQTRMLTFR